MASLKGITTDQLRQMLHLTERIEYLQGVLSSLRRGAAPVTKTKRKVGRTKSKRTMSPEARAKIGAAQKLRWAKTRG